MEKHDSQLQYGDTKSKVGITLFILRKNPQAFCLVGFALFARIMEGIKNMGIYQMTELMHFLDGEQYLSYGIRWEDIEIEDISLDRYKLEQLIDWCNHFSLDSIHLYDIVEDFLAEESTEQVNIHMPRFCS